MSYSVWVPQALTIVRATGFCDGLPVDRTRSLNTHRDLSSNVFLEDPVTLLDLAVDKYAASTFVVTTTKESKDSVAELLQRNHFGGPTLGLGSLRIPGVLRSSQDYSSLCRLDQDVAPVKLRGKTLFYLEALSEDSEFPPVAERAYQQLRIASCCTYTSGVSGKTLVDSGLISPKEYFLSDVLEGYVSALVNMRNALLYTHGGGTGSKALPYWGLVARQATAAVTAGWDLSRSGLLGAYEELHTLPVDRVINLLKKATKRTLLDPRYNKPRKHYLREEKSFLEGSLAIPTAKFLEYSKDLLLGMDLMVAWLSGEDFSEDASEKFLLGISNENNEYNYELNNLLRTLQTLYVSLPRKPRDAVADFVLRGAIQELQEALYDATFDLANKRHAETFAAAASLGPLLPLSLKDKMAEHLDALLSGVALACRRVINGESDNIVRLMATLNSARECGLLKEGP